MKTKAYFIITFSLFLLISVAFPPSSPKTLELPKASADLTVYAVEPRIQSAEITKEVVKIQQAPPPVKTNPPAVKKPAPKPISCDDGNFHTQFLCLLNEYRKSKKLNTLSYDPALNATAAAHSAWMSNNSSLSHAGENGSKFFERCQQQQTTCDAENVAMGYVTAQKLFDAWEKSPAHNTNMIGSHTKIGLSLVGKYSTLLMR